MGLARGGRYDEVGSVFGRNRPAVGFSLDLKRIADLLPAPEPPGAVLAPWREDPGLREQVRRLRAEGEIVVSDMPGQVPEGQAFECDRELVERAGRWIVQPRDAGRLRSWSTIAMFTQDRPGPGRNAGSAAMTSEGATPGNTARNTASMTPRPPGVCDSRPAENESRKAPSTVMKAVACGAYS